MAVPASMQGFLGPSPVTDDSFLSCSLVCYSPCIVGWLAVSSPSPMGLLFLGFRVRIISLSCGFALVCVIFSLGMVSGRGFVFAGWVFPTLAALLESLPFTGGLVPTKEKKWEGTIYLLPLWFWVVSGSPPLHGLLIVCSWSFLLSLPACFWLTSEGFSVFSGEIGFFTIFCGSPPTLTFSRGFSTGLSVRPMASGVSLFNIFFLCH